MAEVQQSHRRNLSYDAYDYKAHDMRKNASENPLDPERDKDCSTFKDKKKKRKKSWFGSIRNFFKSNK